MKRGIWMLTMVAFISISAPLVVKAQAEEAEQLLLNWEKLSQLRKILRNMYNGYKIVVKGYTTIKDISEGNFNLHKTFLDGLMEVSPAVKKYRRVAAIIDYELRMVKSCKDAFAQFQQEKTLTIKEVVYLGKVYDNLLQHSLQNLEDLVTVITAGKLRMSDEERLKAIDAIFSRVEEQFAFLKDFNSGTLTLSRQREREQKELEIAKRIQGVK